jgi:phage tail protein X
MPLPSLYPTGTKESLRISRCHIDEDTGVPTARIHEGFHLLINPAEFTHSRTIAYNDKRSMGESANPIRFNSIDPDEVSFSVVFDGTGVVTEGLLCVLTPVEEQIKSLSDIVYRMDGDTHEPSHVQLKWGSSIFYVRLISMSITYTLFKPSGKPLRAKATLKFKVFVNKKQEALAAGRNSPDLSHSVEVRDGDTLPMLCKRIYGDSRYYTAVARFNGLREFRQLPPGLRLHFPPLGA